VFGSTTSGLILRGFFGKIEKSLVGKMLLV
jgi:hypothetical protein